MRPGNQEPTFAQIQGMPRFTIEELEVRLMSNAISQVPPVNDSRYGEPQDIVEIDGAQVTVNYSGNEVKYVIPRDSAWTAGQGAITIGTAFRMFDEGQESAHLREVNDPNELKSAAVGYYQRILDASKR